jgi:hypothetical protein
MLQELHLLPVQRENANLRCLNPRPDECFDELPHEFGFCCVLYEIAGTGIQGRNSVCVYEEGSTTGEKN